jgi:cytochrome c553
MLGAIAFLAVLPLTPQDSPVDFVRDVRPILEARCTGCHGVKRQRGKLRLDRRPAIPGVVVPGDLAASPLYERVTSDDPEERMPAEGEPLAAAQIALLARWIEEGATWPADAEEATEPRAPHWAYVAPVRPEVPGGEYVAPAGPEVPRGEAGWARNPIDRFVLARMQEQELAPAPEADRATLLRRASLDLTGLPPTPEEVDRFHADASRSAWEDAVDRLLASPQHAEHLARGWLDLARYADTDGYEKDARRSMWRWRDWVIEAFAQDMPFDRFTILQLAGDLVPDATPETILATGFHRNTLLNKEGGTDPEEFRVAAVKDRVDTTATVWLGSTLACAQCHDHKYDPFTQRDYYRFLAFFDGTEDVGNANAPEIPAPRPVDRARDEALRAEQAALEARLVAPDPELDATFARWNEAWGTHAITWTRLRPDAARAREGSTLTIRDDGSVLASGELPATDGYELELTTTDQAVAVLAVQVLTDPTLPGDGPGRPSHRNFVLNELTLEREGPDGEWLEVGLAGARADHEQHGSGDWPAAAALDGDPATGWAIARGEGRSHTLLVALEAPLEARARLRLRLEQAYGSGHLIGCLAIDANPVPAPDEGPVPAPGLRPDDMEAWFRERAPALAPARERLAAIERELTEVPTAMVLRERAEPRVTHVLRKGDFLDPGEAVEAGVPGFLPPLAVRDPQGRADRLDLARWIVSPENPLTARVLVNRTWERFFGRGLVATSQDLGTQGELPTHPELLDWLAVELVERGWSVRELERLIVTSATYRQRSVVSPAAREHDPDNRWLARAPRLRVEAETVRDVALFASGLLCDEIGGPSVFPPQPEGVWRMAYSDDRWSPSEGCDRYRRGLYTFLRRTAPYPAFLAFDATSREVTCPRRARTNTPLQALTTLNDPAFVECAVALAGRMMAEGGEEASARAARGFRLCVAREPEAVELDVLLELYRAQREVYAGRPDEARALVGILMHGDMGDEALDPVELAAWTVVANALLNLDETITRG